MASGPITSWQIDGETVETVADFIFLGSKITADGDCSHEKTPTPWKVCGFPSGKLAQEGTGHPASAGNGEETGAQWEV